MDFSNYLAALGTLRTETHMTRITISTPADLFNPAARDGATLWVALRLIPVALILAAVLGA